jgi:hypothetical protein
LTRAGQRRPPGCSSSTPSQGGFCPARVTPCCGYGAPGPFGRLSEASEPPPTTRRGARLRLRRQPQSGRVRPRRPPASSRARRSRLVSAAEAEAEHEPPGSIDEGEQDGADHDESDTDQQAPSDAPSVRPRPLRGHAMMGGACTFPLRTVATFPPPSVPVTATSVFRRRRRRSRQPESWGVWTERSRS